MLPFSGPYVLADQAKVSGLSEVTENQPDETVGADPQVSPLNRQNGEILPFAFALAPPWPERNERRAISRLPAGIEKRDISQPWDRPS